MTKGNAFYDILINFHNFFAVHNVYYVKYGFYDIPGLCDIFG